MRTFIIAALGFAALALRAEFSTHATVSYCAGILTGASLTIPFSGLLERLR